MHFRSLMLMRNCAEIAAMHLYKKANLKSVTPGLALCLQVTVSQRYVSVSASRDFHTCEKFSAPHVAI